MCGLISVIIIYYNRPENLRNTLKGLAAGSVLPNEVVVVEMDTKKSDIDFFNLNYTHHLLYNKNSKMLPLASARNKGAELANYENLVFLDVDCIPSKTFIAGVQTQLPFENKLFMGTPKYLIQSLIESVDNLEEKSVDHPRRPKVSEVTLSNDYGLFWSLCFFISNELFYKVGGFDDQFIGYGGEDTDFALKIKHAEIEFYITPYIVYHQQHAFYRPPLNHFNAIVQNSNVYFKKWNRWPMEKHLQKFSEIGLINWEKDTTNPIKIKKTPDIKTLKNSLILNESYS